MRGACQHHILPSACSTWHWEAARTMVLSSGCTTKLPSTWTTGAQGQPWPQSCTVAYACVATCMLTITTAHGGCRHARHLTSMRQDLLGCKPFHSNPTNGRKSHLSQVGDQAYGQLSRP